MVDLQSQYQKIQPEIDKAINEVVASAAFINGPEVKSFQSDLEEYLGVKHVIPCANGTDALQIALMALGLKPGDEVITTALSWTSSSCGISPLPAGRRRPSRGATAWSSRCLRWARCG